VYHDAGVSYDSQEPREYKANICPGCHERFHGDLIAAHLTQCGSGHLIDDARPTGPDGRVQLNGKSYVFDVTVVSPTASSFLKKAQNAALDARTKEKSTLYKAQVEARGEIFVIAGMSCFGALSQPTVDLITSACLIPSSTPRIDPTTALRRISRAALMATGRILHHAERSIGAIHRRTVAPTAPPAYDADEHAEQIAQYIFDRPAAPASSALAP
jgi:hypothetical protein